MQPPDRSTFVHVGKLSDFREGRGTVVKLDGTRVAVFNVGGKLRALRDACPHMGASLAEGRILEQRVVCHWHGWTFDLETGSGAGRTRACARTFDVRIADGEVYLRRPPPADPAPAAPDEDWIAWNPDEHLK